MRSPALVALLASVSTFAAAPAIGVVVEEHPRELRATLTSVPQEGSLSAGVAFDLTRRLTIGAGGWHTVASADPTYLRGGWLAAQLQVVDLPSVDMWVRGRGLVVQAVEGERLLAGVGADAHTVLRPTSWFSLVPEFEVLWTPPNELRGPTTLSRLSLAYRFHSGAWTIDAVAGAQAWFREEAILSPFGALAVDWHGRFERVDLGVGGGIALSRDGWCVVGHPLLLEPTAVLQPWLFARLSVAPRFDW